MNILQAHSNENLIKKIPGVQKIRTKSLNQLIYLFLKRYNFPSQFQIRSYKPFFYETVENNRSVLENRYVLEKDHYVT